jgi:hypothetical protein
VARLEALLARRPVRFALTGAVAVVASLATFAIARRLGADGVAPTALRLAVALPILYLGYSRWMLIDQLAADRARVGRRGAELRMVARVAGAVAASSLSKLALEPWLVADLERRGAAAWVDLAPLAGDLVYGPGLAYAVLALTGRLRSTSSSVRSASAPAPAPPSPAPQHPPPSSSSAPGPASGPCSPSMPASTSWAPPMTST